MSLDRSASAPIEGPSVHGNASTLAVLIVLMGLLLGLSVHRLLLVVDMWPLQARLTSDWIYLFACLLNALIALFAWRAARLNSASKSIAGWLIYFGMINVLALCSAAVQGYFLTEIPLFFLLHYVLAFLLSALSALAYFQFASAVSSGDDRAVGGYRLPLRLGLFGLGLFSLIYVFDFPTAFFAVFTHLTCLCALLAFTRVGRFFDQSGRRFAAAAFTAVFLGGPVAYYANRHAEQLGMVVQAGGELVDIIIDPKPSGRTSISATTDTSTLGQTDQGTKQIYNDYWLFSDQERLAVSDEQLMHSVDGGASWEKVKDLVFPGDAIHFDSTGQRGWVGDRFNGKEVTVDGGETWQELTTEAAYRRVTGKRLKENLLRETSSMHLDPETGFGSFTTKCKYFYTRDFAKTWSSKSVVGADGKKICLLDSAFAMDSTQTLALAGGMLLQQLYRYNETLGYWEPICDLDSELSSNACATLDTLSAHEQQFVAPNNWPYDHIYGGTNPHPSLREQIDRFSRAAVSAMHYPPHQAGDTHWFADKGYLATTKNKGESWQTEINSPDFTRLMPVDEHIAFGLEAESTLWISRNAGSSWQRYFSPTEDAFLDFETTANGAYLWLLFPTKLVRIDAISQQSTVVNRWPLARFNRLEASSDGRAMWMYRSGGYALSASFDTGQSWHAFTARKVQRFNDGKWAATPISAMDCSATTPSCVLLREDDSLSEVVLKHDELQLASVDAIVLPPVEGEPSYSDSSNSVLEIGDNGVDLFVIVSEGRMAYLSHDKGESWSQPSLGDDSYWYASRVSDNASSIAISGDEVLSFSHDFGQSWQAINPVGWQDSELDFCWAPNGELIYIFDDEHLAKSFDGGENWSQYATDDWRRPVCGIGNGFVWLRTSQTEIHAVGENNE